MAEKFIKLYTPDSSPDAAFFLTSGAVFFYASTADKYAIHGKNLIVGTTEIIMKNLMNTPTQRLETAIADPASVIKKMSAEKFLSGMKTFSFALNVSIVLAKQVFQTNQIINKTMSGLTSDDTRAREYAMEYYKIMSRLQEEFNKRRLPWMKPLLSFGTSLTFKKGEAFFKSSEPTKITAVTELSDQMVEFPRGATICEENTCGEDMFILHSGAIDVFIGGNRVASIEGEGTVIGEMALLLGEKRTATLKAKNNVVITRIKKENLKEIVEKQSDLLMSIAMALAKRHYYNLVKIGNVNRTALEQAVAAEGGGEKKSQSEQALKELNALKRGTEDACKGKDASFIEDLLKSF